MIGITYVLLFKEIKAKHLGFFYARLPSLQVLDAMNQRAIVDRLDVPDRRPDRRRRLGGAGARGYAAIRASQAMSLAGSEDLRRAASAGRSIRSSCSRARRIGWSGRRAA